MLTDHWRKSTRSGPNSDNCLEARFKKSTRSGAAGHCVEVGMPDGMVHVRDTKDHGAGPELRFTPDEWRAFLAGAADGEFDLPG
jgi:hypothetical protein